MGVNKLEIKDFTVFKDITIHAGSGINVIIGENGTGKTHVLKLLYSASLSLEYKFEKGFISEEDVLNILKIAMEESTSDSFDYIFGTKVKDMNINFEDIDIEYSASGVFSAVFIPAKEMLSMSQISFIYDKYSNDFPMDITLIDIIRKAQALKPNDPPTLALKIAPDLESIIEGTVFMKEDGTFWIRKHNEMEIPFGMESEGFRKLGLLWQLIMNESIKEGTVLLWDEPEANINPKLTPVIVDILFSLARQGVQIFLATHDYTFAKYFEIRRKDEDSLQFHSLYKTNEGVKVETGDNFKDLDENVIISSLDELMDEVIEGNMGD